MVYLAMMLMMGTRCVIVFCVYDEVLCAVVVPWVVAVAAAVVAAAVAGVETVSSVVDWH